MWRSAPAACARWEVWVRKSLWASNVARAFATSPGTLIMTITLTTDSLSGRCHHTQSDATSLPSQNPAVPHRSSSRDDRSTARAPKHSNGTGDWTSPDRRHRAIPRRHARATSAPELNARLAHLGMVAHPMERVISLRAKPRVSYRPPRFQPIPGTHLAVRCPRFIVSPTNPSANSLRRVGAFACSAWTSRCVTARKLTRQKMTAVSTKAIRPSPHPRPLLMVGLPTQSANEAPSGRVTT